MYSNQSTYSDISIAIDICGCYQKISISYKKVNETFSEAYPNLWIMNKVSFPPPNDIPKNHPYDLCMHFNKDNKLMGYFTYLAYKDYKLEWIISVH